MSKKNFLKIYQDYKSTDLTINGFFQTFDYNSAKFCVQWGKFYPKNEKKIVFVGKAVNGWCGIVPINIAFGDSEKRIFDLEDQMN